jgi:hypothetical protein
VAQPPDLIELFVRPLEEIATEYMVTGGVASVIYGDPRFTRDVDIVLDMGLHDVGTFLSAFDAADFYLPPREAIEEEVARLTGGHFNVIHHDTALRADVYLSGDDALHRWAFERRLRLDLGRLTISVAPIEYVIIRKLEYYDRSNSDRHLRDVAMMFRISPGEIDFGALEGWCERLGLRVALDHARSFQID